VLESSGEIPRELFSLNALVFSSPIPLVNLQAMAASLLSPSSATKRENLQHHSFAGIADWPALVFDGNIKIHPRGVRLSSLRVRRDFFSNSTVIIRS
jgi:hypothetical protein